MPFNTWNFNEGQLVSGFLALNLKNISIKQAIGEWLFNEFRKFQAEIVQEVLVWLRRNASKLDDL